MSVAAMAQPSTRISRTPSGSSFGTITRQNTMSSYDGRSMRQSKRYSVTALYYSMSAKDLEIEDELARGMRPIYSLCSQPSFGPSVHDWTVKG